MRQQFTQTIDQSLQVQRGSVQNIRAEVTRKNLSIVSSIGSMGQSAASCEEIYSFRIPNALARLNNEHSISRPRRVLS